MQMNRQKQNKQNRVLFCGNFVKDHIVHYRKSTSETVSQTCSLGGSVTFGSLAFAHYISNHNNKDNDEHVDKNGSGGNDGDDDDISEEAFRVEIVSNMDASRLTRSEYGLIREKLLLSRQGSSTTHRIRLPNHHQFLSSSRSEKWRLDGNDADESSHMTYSNKEEKEEEEEEEPYLTSYSLMYNDDNTVSNERLLRLSVQGPSMNDAHWLASQCMMTMKQHDGNDCDVDVDVDAAELPLALFFVPVAAEFDEVAVCHVMHQMEKRYRERYDAWLSSSSHGRKPPCPPKFPLVCCDVQGFLRTFSSSSQQQSLSTAGPPTPPPPPPPLSTALSNIVDSSSNVHCHSSLVMRQKLAKLGRHVFLLKADATEANAVLRDDASSEQAELKPMDCAKLLHQLFDFPVICITMGSQGCIVACKQHKSTGKIFTMAPPPPPHDGDCEHVEQEEQREQTQKAVVHKSGKNISDEKEYDIVYRYIPAYRPRCTVDETGCGDTFLSCLMAELLLLSNSPSSPPPSSSQISSSQPHAQTHTQSTPNHKNSNDNHLHTEQVFHAVKMASAATSFVVECVGPMGFVSRNIALTRVQHGETIPLCIELE